MKLTKIAIIVCLLFGVALVPQRVTANEVVFFDDFSSGLEKWEQTRGNESIWSVVDGQAQALVTSFSTLTELIPKDEFWSQNWKNIEYSLDFTPIEGADKNITFGFQNVHNWYDLHFVHSFVELTRIMDGWVILSEFFDFAMQSGKTYHLVVQFIEGRIVVEVDGKKVVDVTDQSFNNNFGKIALRASTGAVFPTKVLFDNVVVSLLNELELNLNVALFKQSDPQWRDAEYDSAIRWSDRPTIQRWGCALTSAVMILRYHGITQLPDGSNLTPLSLNLWLKNQTDGYLGQGGLNWLAVTRLTKLVSDRLQTPKLEYSRHAGSSLDVAKSEIENNKPVILEIPGHFLVADGLTENKQDLLIKDPAYNYNHLSQHKTQPLSTRTFQPSQTDLSYLMLISDPSLEVTLTTAEGRTIPEVQSFIEYIQADPSDSLSPAQNTKPMRYLQLAKPPVGDYRITIKQNRFGPYKLQVLTYDQNGNSTIHDRQGQVGQQPTTFTLQYSGASSQVQKLTAKPPAKKPFIPIKKYWYWWPKLWQLWSRHR